MCSSTKSTNMLRDAPRSHAANIAFLNNAMSAPNPCIRGQLHPLPDNKFSTTNKPGKLCYPAVGASTLQHTWKQQSLKRRCSKRANRRLQYIWRGKDWPGKSWRTYGMRITWTVESITAIYHQLTRKKRVTVLCLHNRNYGLQRTPPHQVEDRSSSWVFLWCRIW